MNNRQLGHGDKRSRLVPEKICGALAAVRAVAVSAGCEHSLVLAAGGAVYSFGFGSHGRLGHGDEEARCNATPARPPFPAPPRAPPPSATSPPEHGGAADCTRGELTQGSSLRAAREGEPVSRTL